MRAFLAALQFLTILPLPAACSPGTAALERSVPFFPLVGLLIGVAVAFFDLGLGLLLPPLLASVLVVIALLVASGGLHLDGLADTADGFLSSRPRERILEIMKDSRSGPMAVAAVVCVLSLKMTALAEVPAAWRFGAIVLMAMAGRCALVLQLTVLPYARKEGGLAAVFQKTRGAWRLLWALALLVGAAWLALGPAGLAAAGGALLVALLFCLYAWRKIGGLTGDTLGAVCELAETTPALVLVAWTHGGRAI